jgi:DNA sulfur modification protein DndD
MSVQAEYRIVSVKLQNYRQYYGKQEAPLSPRSQGFSVFLGENGEGKSNLLNAINWCFFHREPHLKDNKGMPIINTRYLDELQDGSVAEMSVSVEIERGTTKYRITRTLKGVKNKLHKEKVGKNELILMDQESVDPVPRGFEVLKSETDESFLVSHEGGSFQTEQFKAGVTQLLPEKLAPFYLLDGEFLAKLFDQFQGIEQGIEQVSQLELISNAKSHVAHFVSSISPGRGQDVDRVTNDIRNLTNVKNSLDPRGNVRYSQDPRYRLEESGDSPDEEYHPASGLPRMKTKEDDLKRIRVRLQQISEELGNNSAASVKQLEQDEGRVTEDLKSEKKYLDRDTRDYRDLLIGFGPVVFLKEALSFSKNEIESQVELGKLPNKITIIFTDSLLKKGECFCGANLNGDGNPHRAKVIEKQKQARDDARLDAAIELEYDYGHLLNDYESQLRRFDEKRQAVKEHNAKLLSLQRDWKSLRDAIKNSGNERARVLVDEQESLLNLITNISEEIGDIKRQIYGPDGIDSQIKEKLGELRKISSKNEKAKRLTHELSRWQTAAEDLDTIYSNLKESIRVQVQEKTTTLFKQVMWKQDFDQVVIDENYNLKVLKGQYNAITELSSGERMFLALSFIAAIRDITGYKFPLIIDTPLGRISGTPRIKIAQRFNEFLPNSQLVLLATDTEYISPILDIDNPDVPGKSFKEYLEETVPTKIFRIKMDKNKMISAIEPYSPKIAQAPVVKKK